MKANIEGNLSWTFLVWFLQQSFHFRLSEKTLLRMEFTRVKDYYVPADFSKTLWREYLFPKYKRDGSLMTHLKVHLQIDFTNINKNLFSELKILFNWDKSHWSIGVFTHIILPLLTLRKSTQSYFDFVCINIPESIPAIIDFKFITICKTNFYCQAEIFCK